MNKNNNILLNINLKRILLLIAGFLIGMILTGKYNLIESICFILVFITATLLILLNSKKMENISKKVSIFIMIILFPSIIIFSRILYIFIKTFLFDK